MKLRRRAEGPASIFTGSASLNVVELAHGTLLTRDLSDVVIGEIGSFFVVAPNRLINRGTGSNLVTSSFLPAGYIEPGSPRGLDELDTFVGTLDLCPYLDNFATLDPPLYGELAGDAEGAGARPSVARVMFNESPPYFVSTDATWGSFGTPSRQDIAPPVVPPELQRQAVQAIVGELLARGVSARVQAVTDVDRESGWRQLIIRVHTGASQHEREELWTTLCDVLDDLVESWPEDRRKHGEVIGISVRPARGYV
jgi:hypothetical protein